jgi:hypothetical protein
VKQKRGRNYLVLALLVFLTSFVRFLSLALDEAMRDLFGELVDRETGDDIWLMGEDVLTRGLPGDDAVRKMKNLRQASS